MMTFTLLYPPFTPPNSTFDKRDVNGDREYQAILRKSDIYSGELDRMDLSKEIRLLINRYVSEQNALGSRFGMLAYLLGFSDCKAMFLGKCLPTEAKEMTTEL